MWTWNIIMKDSMVQQDGMNIIMKDSMVQQDGMNFHGKTVSWIT